MSGIVIVGGKLQGCEAACLAKAAGIEITLIDIDSDSLIRHLCTNFICADVLSGSEEVRNALSNADVILPTMENDHVLCELYKICKSNNWNIAFDWEAYNITTSKIKSDQLFADHGLPCPKYYPEGSFPYVAKPDQGSGSHGVQILHNADELDAYLSKNGNRGVIQEFIEGPSYSVEVIGTPGNYRTYVLTEIFVDDVYDCNKAATYRNIPEERVRKISSLIVEIAEILQLRGIMDLEVIDNDGDIRILEIDARLPSQTPLVVYGASGMNYIKELYDLFAKGKFEDELTDKGDFASLTHYLVHGKNISSHGEHIMVEGNELNYGSETAVGKFMVTDYRPGASLWRCTAVTTATSLEEQMEKEHRLLTELQASV